MSFARSANCWPFFVSFALEDGTICVMPNVYGCSSCSCRVSGWLRPSTFSARMTLLVTRSLVQKFGTVTVCLSAPVLVGVFSRSFASYGRRSLRTM